MLRRGWSGWINFDVESIVGQDNQPRIEKETGILMGYAWSANAGWISLNSPGVAEIQSGLDESVVPVELSLIYLE